MHYFGFNGPIDLDKRISKDTDSEPKKSNTLVVVMENQKNQPRPTLEQIDTSKVRCVEYKQL